jgi:predicted AlkP superfamily pyrophosphatase or phosphodiesterase
MREGAHVEGAVVGSSPSITPAIHATMSTGVFPRRHGVTGIAVRDDDGSIVGAFTPSPNVVGVPVQPGLTLRTTTIADLWDRAHDNKPKVGLIAAGNYPLGLLGRGASLRGGDKDLALFGDHGSGWVSDARYYRKPSYVNVETPGPRAFVPRLDRRDGRADGRWRGHDLSSTDIGNTPAAATWEIRTATAVMEREGFGADRLTDLMYLHFKSPDHVGHRWNMISPEMHDVLRSVDSAIAELVRWLRENIGEGGFVVAVTADHGQTPLDRGGWPINREEILADIQARFDHVSDDLGIIQRTSASSLFSNLAEMRANGIEPEHVASFLSRYTIADNHPADERLPARFAPRADERLFSAVFPGRKLSAVAACTRAEG